MAESPGCLLNHNEDCVSQPLLQLSMTNEVQAEMFCNNLHNSPLEEMAYSFAPSCLSLPNLVTGNVGVIAGVLDTISDLEDKGCNLGRDGAF